MRSASKRWQIGLASMVSPVQLTLISRGEEEEHQLRYPTTYTAWSFQEIETVLPCAQYVCDGCWMDVFVQPCNYENHWSAIGSILAFNWEAHFGRTRWCSPKIQGQKKNTTKNITTNLGRCADFCMW